MYSTFAAVVFLIGAAVAWCFGGAVTSLVAGDGLHPAYPKVHLPAVKAWIKGQNAQIVTIAGGGPLTPWIISAAVILLVWVLLVVRPVMRPGRGNERTKAMASQSAVRRQLSTGATRKAGKFTRPELRGKGAPTEFGYCLGQLRGHKNADIWVN